ncbi:MAG: hypothetical protein M3Q68_00610, partial [Actinomycetota bacterium]|nr:hypothetical protein [Actinomycetota bacterium]
LLAVGLAVANPPALAATSNRFAGDARDRPAASSVFAGSRQPGRVGVESSARGLVAFVGGLPVGRGRLGPWVRSGATTEFDRCPPVDLEVSWAPPVGEFTDGAYVAPLGPPPTDLTTRVNGVVVCRGSNHAFLGFEARWDGARWLLSAVPSLEEETGGALLAGEAAASGATPAEAVADPGGTPSLPPPAEWQGDPLEPLAAYVPQTTCDPTAKPGVLGFRDLLLAAFPGSRNLGIGRMCEAEGVSEHKEGRAFDWGVDIENPAEMAAADEVLAWMLGPDDSGEAHAIARRLGLMYVIWDGRIWSSFQAADGWRPYVGRSDHRDHIHFSFDWAGALGQTTFWRGGRADLLGRSAPDLPLAPVVPRAVPLLPLPGLPVAPPPALPLPIPAPGPGAGGFGPVPEPSSGESAPAPSPPPPGSTTTTAPPATTTTTSPEEQQPTTTTTAPRPTVPLTTPTTIRIGSL